VRLLVSFHTQGQSLLIKLKYLPHQPGGALNTLRMFLSRHSFHTT